MPGLKAQILIFGGLIVLSIFAINTFFPVKIEKPQTPQERAANRVPDASDLACMDFYLLVKDMQKEVLTIGEMREKAKRIQERSEASDSQEIRDAGDYLLRAFTIGGKEDIGRALQSMSKVCKQKSP